jgi:hypothetical protein
MMTGDACGTRRDVEWRAIGLGQNPVSFLRKLA